MNTAPLRIGVDLDDVILDCNTTLCEYHNDHFGTALTLDDVWTHRLAQVWGCTEEEAGRRIYEFTVSPYHERCKVMPGAPEALMALATRYHIDIVTARSEDIREETKRWLARQLPWFRGDLYFTGGSEHKAKRPKSELCRELGVTYFIEDALHNAEDVAPVVTRLFLFERPWNRTTQNGLPANVRRVRAWREIANELL